MENKLKKIAIKGHETRGNEVIELIENLGGVNHYNFKGENSVVYFYKGILKRIETTKYYYEDRFASFTLEEFLEKYPSEKYPYKVGDKVVSSHNKELIGTIVDINWKNDILYTVRWCNGITNNIASYYCYDLQPYKENDNMNQENENESTSEINLNHHCFDEYNKVELIIPNNWEFKEIDGKMFGVRKYFQYPKTYEECCQITQKAAKTTHELDIAYNPNLIYDFQKLLICRDAYWKIAGEQMGLSEPWKPDLTDVKQDKYAITNVCNKIQFELYGTYNGVLVFPTEEMRDAFLENFKDLIESCKEFL